jgi:hypothetical protein
MGPRDRRGRDRLVVEFTTARVPNTIKVRFNSKTYSESDLTLKHIPSQI